MLNLKVIIMVTFKSFYLPLLYSLLFVSCIQDDIVYSCDEETDMWIKENLVEIQVFTRNDWKEFDPVRKKGVYNAFTPKQKIQFWLDKMKEIKQLDWNKKEILHIQKVEDYIHSHKVIFDSESRNQNDMDDMEIFFYKWKEYALNELGWSLETIYSIAATGESINVSKNSANTSGESGSFNPDANNDCNCNTGSSISCFPAGGYCDKARCDKTTHGCGWLWVSECNGRCGGF